VLRFGIPAILASFIGAWLLLKIGDLRPLYEYYLGTKFHTITPVKLIIAVLLLVFTLSEIIPLFSRLTVNRNMLPVGGLLSGFFGGLSGLQGAIRGAFLVKAGLSAEAYIATGAVIACMVDFTRLSIYTSRFINSGLADNIPLVLAASLSAITGAFAGKNLIQKVTVGFVRKLVVIMLIGISIALGTGIL
jgi:uncharacterized protein